MKRKIEIFCICLVILVVLISFRNNFVFFFNHMAGNDANLGVALSGFPFSFFLLVITVHFLLEKRKWLSGMIFILTAPILMFFELIIHFLRDDPSVIRIVMMYALYSAAIVFGIMQSRRAIKNQNQQQKPYRNVIVSD